MSVAVNGSTEFVRRGEPKFTIRPSGRWRALHLAETWRFRDLLMSLAVRDLKLRYKQTAMGIAWVVLQPLLTAGIFSIVFGVVGKMDTDGMPPFLFSFTGLLGYNLFNNTITRSSTCLIGNSQLITKVFFPRLILPFSVVPAVLIDFAVAAGLMVLLMIGYHGKIHTTVPWVPSLLLVPVWLVILTVLAMGTGLCAAALTVRYRDIQYIVPFVLQVLLYATPIAYSVSKVSPTIKAIYTLNPLTALIRGVDWSLLGTPAPSIGGVAYGVVAAAALFVIGAFGFRRMEKQFADVI